MTSDPPTTLTNLDACGRRLFVLTCLTALVLAPSLATAQKPGKKDEDKGTPEVVESKTDGLPIHFTYIAADPAKVEGGTESAPVVILIHGAKGDRLIWENKPTNFKKRTMAQTLRDEGFAVVTVDMRGHGESKLPDEKPIGNSDYAKMAGDIEAVKAFLLTEHQAKKLNIAKLGIVAADDFAPVALNYAMIDWQKPDYDDAPVPSRRTPRGRDVKAVGLLSPTLQSGNVKAMKPLVFLKNPRVEIAAYIGVGTDDPSDDKTAERIAKQFRTEKSPDDNFLFEKYNTRLRGTDLIGQAKMKTELHLMLFLKKSLQELEIPWRNRQSRIAR